MAVGLTATKDDAPETSSGRLQGHREPRRSGPPVVKAKRRLAAAMAVLLCFAATPVRAAEPVIIDTDVGDDIDDAFALALAASDPSLDVLGVTTAWGDTALRQRLTVTLLAAAGRPDIPVAQGRATPDAVRFTQAAWAAAGAEPPPGPDALALIRDAVRRRPGQITLVALAPLSNIDDLIARDPETLRGLKRVVMMGGSIYAGYGATETGQPTPPSAEYNVARLPKAFARLLALGVPVVLFPLDSTQLKLEATARDRIFAQGSPLGPALAELYGQWRNLNAWRQVDPTLFDVVPIAALLDPSLCPTTPLRIAVDDQGFTRPVDGPPNVRACLSLRRDAALALILRHLAPPKPGA
jgi:inosine-uridine nucleoside N-ribohydrolase